MLMLCFRQSENLYNTNMRTSRNKKRKFVWKGIAYPDRSSWMKAVRADPECEANRMHNLRLAAARSDVREKHSIGSQKAWKGKLGSVRRKAARTEKRRAIISKGCIKKWADPKYHARMTKVRKEQGQRPEIKENCRRAAQIQWSGASGRRMRKERRDRWKNPVYREMMHRRFRNPEGTSWNVGLTKETHPSLQKISDKLMGRIPNYGGRPVWYHNYEKQLHIAMWSKPEVEFAQWCDKRNIEWQYEPRWFNIGKGNYTGNSYTPDFYLPVLKTYVEIKGRFTQENLRKMQAFYRKYPDVKLFFVQQQGLRALRASLEHIPRRKPINQHVKGRAA